MSREGISISLAKRNRSIRCKDTLHSAMLLIVYVSQQRSAKTSGNRVRGDRRILNLQVSNNTTHRYREIEVNAMVVVSLLPSKTKTRKLSTDTI